MSSAKVVDYKAIRATPPKIVSLTKTCDAAPAQWQGKLANGHDIYIRYRYGYLSVRMGEQLFDEYGDPDAWDDALVYQTNPGHAYDSVMETGEMLGYIAIIAVLADGVQVDEPYRV
jgi:hypothetical protein